MASNLVSEDVWLNQHKVEEAEGHYRQYQAGVTTCSSQSQGSSLAGELAQVRQDIQNVLNKPLASAAGGDGDACVYRRLDALEKENKNLKKTVDELRALVLTIQASLGGKPVAAAPSSKPAVEEEEDDDDDDDLFGDDDEDEDKKAEAEALKQKRIKEYAERKSKKPALVPKSSITLDIKPWDDETDMKEVEAFVRKIEKDGLVWGSSKLVEVGYGIKKLVIIVVVEDDKVSVDDLEERILSNEDHIQSMDIAAFNKI